MNKPNHTTTLRIGGVPEHFNLPVHRAIERGEFEQVGLNIEWITYPGGTGEMTTALKEQKVDACILLTEGIVNAIINGNPSKIISEYVTTPLCWGVHTNVNNPLDAYHHIYDKKYAISRNGSGSHLMAIIDAHGQGHALNENQFKVVQNINGALPSLEAMETDVFYWEKFTTKPYVDAGILKRIGEFPTPWPSFVIAASDNILNSHAQAIASMLKIIHKSCQHFMIDIDAVVPEVAERYGLKQEDAENWFHRTAWATNGWVSDKMIASVVYNLKLANIISQDKAIPELIWKRK